MQEGARLQGLVQGHRPQEAPVAEGLAMSLGSEEVTPVPLGIMSCNTPIPASGARAQDGRPCCHLARPTPPECLPREAERQENWVSCWVTLGVSLALSGHQCHLWTKPG